MPATAELRICGCAVRRRPSPRKLQVGAGPQWQKYTNVHNVHTCTAANGLELRRSGRRHRGPNEGAAVGGSGIYRYSASSRAIRRPIACRGNCNFSNWSENFVISRVNLAAFFTRCHTIRICSDKSRISFAFQVTSMSVFIFSRAAMNPISDLFTAGMRRSLRILLSL